MTERLDKCTIYVLTNEVNGKIYIGQSWYPLNIRMGKYGENYKHSIYLYNAIKKYGADKFKYDILDVCYDQDTADFLENFYIEKYNSRDHNIGYNIKTGGNAGCHSEETKAKISATLKYKASLWTQEELARRSECIAGWWAGKKRGPHTEKRKEENSTRMKEWHANHVHPMLGKHHSEEAKLNISKKNTGRKFDPEVINKRRLKLMMNFHREQKIVNAYKNGKTISDIEEEFNTCRSSIYRIIKRNNIPCNSKRNTWAGRKHSEETKKKMSIARKNYWKYKKGDLNQSPAEQA